MSATLQIKQPLVRVEGLVNLCQLHVARGQTGAWVAVHLLLNLRYCSPSVTGYQDRRPRIPAPAEDTCAYAEDLMDLQTVVAALNKPPYNYGVTAVTLRFVISALVVLLVFFPRK